MHTLKELYKIGKGPSSSHTVGPMKAAKRFIDNLIDDKKLSKVERVKVDLYGSLALTGVGHGTLNAVIYGLMGLVAENVDTDQPYFDSVRRDKILHLASQKPISFDLPTSGNVSRAVQFSRSHNAVFVPSIPQVAFLSEEYVWKTC